ncbi:WD40 repeat domain-containing protein [Virgisporangium aliadipatigenens]|uniref:WD40 repeat domain-containing protein n=1 Tax=Virgisporangium aliadipatigenens TaxID=741659 RepID=UPI001942F68D|nr:WD40 repeat domain-containing protein [Virgisporangium aliadipatigenens]
MADGWRWLDDALRERGPAGVPEVAAFAQLLGPVEPASALVDIACSRLGVAPGGLPPARRLVNRWPLPDVFPGLRRVIRAPAAVRSLAVTPDGELVAGCSYGHVLGRLARHPDRVAGVAVSATGLVASTSGESVRLSDLRTGALLREVPVVEAVCTDVAVTADGSLVAASINRGEVWLLDAATGEVRERFAAGTLPQAVAVSPDGTWVAAAGFDYDIHLWNGVSTVHDGHSDVVYALAASPDGALLASGGDRSGIVWDPRTGRRVATLEHGADVHAVAFSPDGRLVATAGDGPVRVWDARSGARVRTFRGNHRAVWGLAFGPSGEWVASGCDAGDVRLWTVEDRSVRPGGTARRSRWGGAVAAADGTWIAAIRDDAVELRDAATAQRLRTLRHDASALILAAARNGAWLAAAHTDRTIRVHDPHDGRLLHNPTAGGRAAALAAAPDGTWLLVAGGHSDGWAEAHDLTAGELRWRITPPTRVQGTAIGRDGTWCALVHEDRISIVDGTTGALRHTLDTTGTSAVTVDPCTDLLVTAGADGVRHWDAESGAVRGRVARSGVGRVHAMAVSPDGSLLAMAGWTNELRVHEIGADRPVAAMRVDATWVNTVCWLPDGALCVTADPGIYVFTLT